MTERLFRTRLTQTVDQLLKHLRSGLSRLIQKNLPMGKTAN